MRQGCKLFKVIPPHLILVARICVCIIIGSLDWVIEASRQVDWFHIKFKSIVGLLSLAKIYLSFIQIWSLHFCLAIIVWESTVADSCIWHWHKTKLQTFSGCPSPSYIKCLDCVCIIIGVWIELLMHWGRSSCLSLKGYYSTFSIQGEIIKMVPSRVDSNKKRAKSSIGQVEEELFWIDRMRTTVSGPSQATVHLADKTPQD